MHCSLEELSRRETGRGDGQLGNAERHNRTIYVGERYDMELSAQTTADATVDRSLDHRKSRKRPLAFDPLATD